MPPPLVGAHPPRHVPSHTAEAAADTTHASEPREAKTFENGFAPIKFLTNTFGKLYLPTRKPETHTGAKPAKFLFS